MRQPGHLFRREWGRVLYDYMSPVIDDDDMLDLPEEDEVTWGLGEAFTSSFWLSSFEYLQQLSYYFLFAVTLACCDYNYDEDDYIDDAEVVLRVGSVTMKVISIIVNLALMSFQKTTTSMYSYLPACSRLSITYFLETPARRPLTITFCGSLANHSAINNEKWLFRFLVISGFCVYVCANRT